MKPRFTIGTLVLVVVLMAFDFAWIRLLHPSSGRSIFAFAAQGFDLGVLPMANVVVFGIYMMCSRRGSSRTFLAGFVAFGLGAIVAYMVWCWVSPKTVVLLIMPLFHAVRLWRSVDPSGPVILVVAAMSLTLPQLLIATFGGWITRGFIKRRTAMLISRSKVEGANPL